MRLTIIIPCYNEAKNIPLLLEKLDSVMNREDVGVMLVDNGSSDNTAEVMDELLPKYPFADRTKVEVNQGYGFGILSGLEKTTSDYIGWTHADMQTDPADLIKAMEIIEGRGFPENIFVKGLRKGRPLFDQVFTTGMSIFETLYLRRSLFDINAQPNIFHRKFYESWADPPHDFSLDLYVLFMARVNKLDLVHFPVLFPERIHGESHWNTSFGAKWKFIKRTLDFSTELKRRLKQSNL